MPRRHSTVFDAAALRLHPDGGRISTDDVVPVTSVLVKNKNTYRHKDAKARWVATDAAGDGKITKRRKIVDDHAGSAGEACTAEANPTEFPQTKEMPVKVFKDSRANRRVAFENDLTFLAAPRLETEGDQNSHLHPSSDFLKCIHHFTSRYYGSTNQLFDSGRQYRKEKKERKQRRILQIASKETQSIQTESSGGEENNLDAGDSVGEGKKEQEDKPRSEKWTPKKKETRKDMYRALDGSALLCIGMLLQAQVSSSLADQIPEMWEDELEAYKEKPGDKKTDYIAGQSKLSK
ncbi:hypothetical protein BU17DRAFT_88688 [Hysterangium stoloniferum]|nr:hypothetical protein BU17DRAFT_88688 [Hysterangium stoloniferum]